MAYTRSIIDLMDDVVFILLLITALLTAVSAQPIYSICNHTFTCGSFTSLTYPFTTNNRPSHCGHPSFHLTCTNSTPQLDHNSLTYKLLNLNQNLHSLVLTRADLYNTTCPSRFLSTTLNTTLFNLTLPENDILSLFYGCNTTDIRVHNPANFFTCNNTRFNFTDSYHFLGPVPRDPVLGSISCAEGISVPVMRSAAGDSSMSVGEVLMQGFSVEYSVPFESECSVCSRLGGECGFDSSLGQFICLCGETLCPFIVVDDPHQPSLNGSQGNDSRKRGMEIGISIAGAVLAGIIVGWFIFYIRQLRKKRVAPKSSQTIIKEIKLSHSSKQLLSSTSATFTRSIPSFPSTRSEFGRDVGYFGVQVFDYSELEEATDNFNDLRELGDGGFGTVYYGLLQDGRKIAVKRLYENNYKRVEQFMNEVEILAHLRHEHLVTLYGCTPKRSKELLLVYEYIPNGTVADHLHGNRSKSGLLSWPIRLNIAIETAEALGYLHRSDIIHRDVKTTNVLLDNDFHVKVADFGLSRLFPTNVTHVSTAPQGTPGYVDPEYYQCYHLTEKSDVYSFGVMLIELISSLQAVDTNRHRHDINLSNMAINKIQSHLLHELVDSSLGYETNSRVRRMITSVAELAFRCLQHERDLRPSMEEVLEGLRRIQMEDLNDDMVEIDISNDEDIDLLDYSIDLPSPVSVPTDKQTNGLTTPSSG